MDFLKEGLRLVSKYGIQLSQLNEYLKMVVFRARY